MRGNSHFNCYEMKTNQNLTSIQQVENDKNLEKIHHIFLFNISYQ